jgi:hypothetical protein
MSESGNAESGGQLQRSLEWVLSVALAVDAAKEQSFVNELHQRYPSASKHDLADRLITRSKWWATGFGVATGLPANPWMAAPAAVTDVAAVLRTEVKLAARIALLYDPDYLSDGEPPYELLVPILGARMGSEFLREIAVRGSMGVSRTVIRKYLSKETLKHFKRVVLKYLGLKVTQKGVTTKTLPVVGSVIGGTWNYVELRSVGQRVVAYFEQRELPGNREAS